MWVDRVACTTIDALIERQEPRRLALQLRAKTHLGIIHCHMRHAAPRLEQQLLRVARVLVLDNGIGHRLLGQRILQLEGQHRQAVDEDHQVQLIAQIVAVAHLPGDAEDVLAEGILCGIITRRGQQPVQIDVYRPVVHTRAQHIHHSTFGDLALQPVQKLGAPDPIRLQFQRIDRSWLGCAQESQQLHHIQRHIAVVVTRPAQHVATRCVHGLRLLHPVRLNRRMFTDPRQMADDQLFKAQFTGVSWFHMLSGRQAMALGDGNWSFSLFDSVLAISLQRCRMMRLFDHPTCAASGCTFASTNLLLPTRNASYCADCMRLTPTSKVV